jgi:tetratricopeptide (TPR) repeat protein
VETQRRVMGADDPDTLGSISSLALTLCAEGDCAEGVKLNREVWEKQKRILGSEAHYTLVTMDNLSIMLAENGQPAEAEKLAQEALAIHLRVYGPDNYATINSMINLGEFQRDLKHDEDAKKTIRHTLEIEERIFGPDQPETAVTRYDLASVLARSGQIDEALPLLRQAVDHGLPPRLDLDVEKDPVLNSLRGDPRFEAIVADARERAAAAPNTK